MKSKDKFYCWSLYINTIHSTSVPYGASWYNPNTVFGWYYISSQIIDWTVLIKDPCTGNKVEVQSLIRNISRISCSKGRYSIRFNQMNSKLLKYEEECWRSLIFSGIYDVSWLAGTDAMTSARYMSIGKYAISIFRRFRHHVLWNSTIYKITRSHIPKSNYLHIQCRRKLNLNSLLSECMIEEIQALCRCPFINTYIRTRKWLDSIHLYPISRLKILASWGKKLIEITVDEGVWCVIYTRTFECQTKWELIESKGLWRWCMTPRITGILGTTFKKPDLLRSSGEVRKTLEDIYYLGSLRKSWRQSLDRKKEADLVSETLFFLVI
jgi:hypothetical protein